MDERDGHQRERKTLMQHAYREELVELIGRVEPVKNMQSPGILRRKDD